MSRPLGAEALVGAEIVRGAEIRMETKAGS